MGYESEKEQRTLDEAQLERIAEELTQIAERFGHTITVTAYNHPGYRVRTELYVHDNDSCKMYKYTTRVGCFGGALIKPAVPMGRKGEEDETDLD